MEIHQRRLVKVFTSRFPIANLGLEDLQTYVNKRAKQKTKAYEYARLIHQTNFLIEEPSRVLLRLRGRKQYSFYAEGSRDG